MNFARIRSIVVWLTASLALASRVYAPKERLGWSNDSQSWKRERPLEEDKGKDFIWIIPENCPECLWKVMPDWPRMAGELLLIVGIGGGLILALNTNSKTAL